MSDTAVNKPDQKKPRKYPVDGYHRAKKCRGCPYGYKTYCVGICWKDTYDSVLKKRKKPAEK